MIRQPYWNLTKTSALGMLDTCCTADCCHYILRMFLCHMVCLSPFCTKLWGLRNMSHRIKLHEELVWHWHCQVFWILQSSCANMWKSIHHRLSFATLIHSLQFIILAMYVAWYFVYLLPSNICTIELCHLILVLLVALLEFLCKIRQKSNSNLFWW